MRRKLPYILILFSLFSIRSAAQDKIALDGYISDMQTVYHVPDYWFWENSLHNRFNLEFWPTSWLSGTVQVRNRFIAGNTVSKFGHKHLASVQL